MEELYEYKKLGVLKNYLGSFFSITDDNIDKTREKVGMLLSSSLDRRKGNPLIYAKFRRQACCCMVLSFVRLLLLYCKTGALPVPVSQKYFYVPKSAPGPLLLALSCLNSVESEIETRKLLPLGCLINEPKMYPAVKSFFDSDITSLGVLPSIAEALHKYMSYFISSKIGTTARHSRFVLLGKNLCGI